MYPFFCSGIVSSLQLFDVFHKLLLSHKLRAVVMRLTNTATKFEAKENDFTANPNYPAQSYFNIPISYLSIKCLYTQLMHP